MAGFHPGTWPGQKGGFPLAEGAEASGARGGLLLGGYFNTLDQQPRVTSESHLGGLDAVMSQRRHGGFVSTSPNGCPVAF